MSDFDDVRCPACGGRIVLNYDWDVVRGECEAEGCDFAGGFFDRLDDDDDDQPAIDAMDDVRRRIEARGSDA